MRATTPIQERVWRYVSPEPNSGCWLWDGSVTGPGYAQIYLDAKHTVLVHRLMYEMHIGTIPAHLELDHKCRVRCCVNPAHLEPVTRSENVLRGTSPERRKAQSAKKTHCVNGHPLSDDNLIQTARQRRCRECARAARRRWYQGAAK